MAKRKRDIGQEILEGIRELKRGEHGRITTVPSVSDIREKTGLSQAVFALSQRPKDESVPALVRVAKTHPDPSIRKKALFWLAQSDDPRAIALFEDILRK